MASKTMKKIWLLVTREDMKSLLSELVDLGCIEIAELDILHTSPELGELVTREAVELGEFQANRASLEMIGTQYTLLFSGWIPARSGPELAAKLADYVCAWMIVDPSPGEIDIVPVSLKYPNLFKKYRLAGRKEFEPLSRVRDRGED